MDNPVVLYDGVCGLCNQAVQFLLQHDRKDKLRYAALQSDFSAEILKRHGANPHDLDSICVVLNYMEPDEKLLSRSAAVLRLAKELGGIWRLGSIATILPRPVRDALYNLIARYRYRVFGKYETCMLPDPRHRKKFLDTVREAS